MARRAAAPAATHEPDAEASLHARPIVLIPLDQLYLHPLNARREPPAADIAALADSIRTLGLLQNLSGFADHQIRFRNGHDATNADHIGIVAGGRRLRALQLLAQSGEWPDPVPVRIARDLDTARRWAGAENEAREALSVADEITAYAQMQMTGATIPEVAIAFARTERHVAQRLALAGLPQPALDALRAGKITIDIARLLTRVTNPNECAALLQACLDGKITASWQLRDKIETDTAPATCTEARYLGLDAIAAAGLAITTDLFADQTLIHGHDQLRNLARAKALAELEQVRSDEGWAWATLADDLPYCERRRVDGEVPTLPDGDADRLNELAELDVADVLDEAGQREYEALMDRLEPVFTDEQRATCGIIGSINPNGLHIVRAFFRIADAPATGNDDDTTETRLAAPEAAFPQNLRDDLRAIRLICIQDALRRAPGLCQRLLALQLAGLAPRWEEPFSFTPHHSQPHPVATPPTKTDGLAIPKVLAAPTDRIEPDLTFLQTSDFNIETQVATGLARAFCRTTGPLVDAIHAASPVSPRTLWHPTVSGFLGRVSAGYLDSLYRDLIPDDGTRHAAFAAMTKKQKAAELDNLFNGHQLREAYGLTRAEGDRLDAWLPEDLRFANPEPATA
jgi:ParB family chromosome partitioning protein